MVEGMDGGQFLGQESRLGGRNDESTPANGGMLHCFVAGGAAAGG